MALKLLPALPVRDLAGVAEDGALHALLRSAARRLLVLRAAEEDEVAGS